MAAPQSTPLPDAPQRGEPESVFIPKSNAFVASLEPMRQELQEQADFIDGIYAHDVNIGIAGGVSEDIETVSGIIDDVAQVSSNVLSVNTVSTNAAKVEAVANSVDAIAIASDRGAQVSTVAGANIGAVSGISSGVTGAAGITAQISTLSPLGPDISAISTNAAGLSDYASLSRATARYTLSANQFKPLLLETLRHDGAMGVMAQWAASDGLPVALEASPGSTVQLGESWNNGDFTIHALFEWDGEGTSNRYLCSVSEGVDNDKVRASLRLSESSSRCELIVSDGGLSLLPPVVNAPAQVGMNWFSVAYKNGEFAIVANGVGDIRAETNTYPSADQLRIGALPSGQSGWYGPPPLIIIESRGRSLDNLIQITSQYA